MTTKRKKPINLADQLRAKYKKEYENKKSKFKMPGLSNNIWLNIKSILYTGIIGLVITFFIIGGIVLIPLAILLIIGTGVFVAVKVALSERDEDTDKDKDIDNKDNDHWTDKL